MKTFLVGGAVRDQLLGYPVTERDWVVVGSTPEELLRLGYNQVGKGFPVFIHPVTGEEYALARKERKVAQGYTGFTCDFDSQVKLEDDLARRDLTINAMAMDEQGQLIDPYHGYEDLQKKQLRHVSPAFVEDPVRVLRVARFAARYAHLNFSVANETRVLMYTMAKQGELRYLVAERVWQEWQRSLQERNPEVFITTLRACGALSIILPELDALFGVPNRFDYHPEVDSGVHSLMTLMQAVLLSDDAVVRFAALIHDLGKAHTPMGEWPSHRGHEARGVAVIEQLCSRLRIPRAYSHLALTVSRCHLLIHKLYELPAETIVDVLEKCDAFRRKALFQQVLLACEADAQGTGRKVKYPQSRDWYYILDECGKINAKNIAATAVNGQAVKLALHKQRTACVKIIIESWKQHEK